MNPLSDRYTDRHVREDTSLAEVAELYVQTYTGDFPYIVELRERLVSGAPLTVSHIRGVLNCMRVDSSVLTLPVPVSQPGVQVTRLPVRRTSVQDDDTSIASPQRLPDLFTASAVNDDFNTATHDARVSNYRNKYGDPRRPLWIDVKTTWHYWYVITQSKQSSRVHILNADRSTIRYYPRSGAIRPFISIYYMCGKDPRVRSQRDAHRDTPAFWDRYRNIEFVNQDTVNELIIEHSWKMCKACELMVT